LNIPLEETVFDDRDRIGLAIDSKEVQIKRASDSLSRLEKIV
jgi:hypothetical protein